MSIWQSLEIQFDSGSLASELELECEGLILGRTGCMLNAERFRYPTVSKRWCRPATSPRLWRQAPHTLFRKPGLFFQAGSGTREAEMPRNRDFEAELEGRLHHSNYSYRHLQQITLPALFGLFHLPLAAFRYGRL